MTPLIIIEEDSFLPQLLPKHVILHLKIVDDALLFLAQMRGQEQDDDVPGLEDEIQHMMGVPSNKGASS